MSKKNDSKRNYFSSNKWDAPKEILISEERISKLRNMAQNKRKYTKRDTSYSGSYLWMQGLHNCVHYAFLFMGIVEGGGEVMATCFDLWGWG